MIWLLTPKAGRDGHIEPSEISEAAPTAGLQPTRTISASRSWQAPDWSPRSRTAAGSHAAIPALCRARVIAANCNSQVASTVPGPLRDYCRMRAKTRWWTVKGIPTQYVDSDPEESQEWIESSMRRSMQPGRPGAPLARELLRRASERNLGISDLRQTDYINTIHPEDEPEFPGDEEIEHRIRAYCRWNAAIMVHRAQRPGVAVGGHISSYASSASLYEVGFNHFFNGPGVDGGDQIYYQGHACTGIYARAFLEGRITEDRMDGFRQELSHGGLGRGLPSYPHPRLMSDFGSSPPSPWDSVPRPRSTRPASTATCTIVGSRTPHGSTCGPSSATVRPTSRRPWAIWARQPARAWTT